MDIENKSCDIVYHYCNMDTFNKIISNKELWLTDITKSNDSIKIFWIKDSIKNIFIEEYDKSFLNKILFKNTVIEVFDTYLNDFFDDNNMPYYFFVCCFSEEGDLLSQWRGYADDGKGIAIGFDAHILSKAGKLMKHDSISSNTIENGKIIYDQKEQQNIISALVRGMISNLISLIKKNNPNNLKINNFMKIPEIRSDFMKIMNEYFLCFFKISVFMKNPFFLEENEWRICHCNSGEPIKKGFKIAETNGFEISQRKFYFSESNIKSRVELRFNKVKEQLIREVVLGPKCVADTKEIEAYLLSNEIKCEVKKSKGTYR